MNEIYAKVRAVAIRGLEEAEAAGDFKAAMDASKLLISLEQSIKEDEREAAPTQPAVVLDLDRLSPAELLAHLKERKSSLQQMIETLTPEDFEEPSIEDGEDIDVLEAQYEAQHSELSPPAPEPPAPERCEFCRAPASECEAIRDDQGWLAGHLARPDVKQRLAEQKAFRTKLGWDAAVVKDPFSRGVSADTDTSTEVMMRRAKYGTY